MDDDALIFELTASMLEELGCEVLQARSGNDVLEQSRTIKASKC